MIKTSQICILLCILFSVSVTAFNPFQELRNAAQAVERVTLQPVGEALKAVERVTLQPVGEALKATEKVTLRPLPPVVKKVLKAVLRNGARASVDARGNINGGLNNGRDFNLYQRPESIISEHIVRNDISEPSANEKVPISYDGVHYGDYGKMPRHLQEEVENHFSEIFTDTEKKYSTKKFSTNIHGVYYDDWHSVPTFILNEWRERQEGPYSKSNVKEVADTARKVVIKKAVEKGIEKLLKVAGKASLIPPIRAAVALAQLSVSAVNSQVYIEMMKTAKQFEEEGDMDTAQEFLKEAEKYGNQAVMQVPLAEEAKLLHNIVLSAKDVLDAH